MKTVNAILHLAAAAIALCVTTSIVWAMANVGYPVGTPSTLTTKRGDCSPS